MADAPLAQAANARPPATVALLLAAGLVAALAWLAHAPVLSARAVWFDDDDYFTRNALVQNPGAASARRFFTEVQNPSTVRGYYQPLTMISLMLDVWRGARPDNLRPIHQTQLALHALNAALICLIVGRLFGRVDAALAVALLFAWHPLTVEPLAWIGERKTLLSTALALASLLAYVGWAQRRGWWRYAVVLVAYALSLLAKPTSVALPLVMMVLDFWPLNRLTVRTLLEKLPLIALLLAGCAVTFVSQRTSGSIIAASERTPRVVALIVAHNVALYARQMVWPVGLSAGYLFPRPFDLSNSALRVALGVSLALGAGVIVSLRWTRAGLVAALVFAVLVFPTMGAVGFTYAIASDKYVYLPMLGPLLALGAGLAALLRTAAARPGRTPQMLLVLAIGAAAWLEHRAARQTLAFWADTESLNRHALAVNPDNPAVHHNLASHLAAAGRLDEAAEHYQQSSASGYARAASLNGLGLIRHRQGRETEAIALFHEALACPRLDRHTEAHARMNLALALANTRDVAAALREFAAALALRPELVEARLNYADLLARTGRLADAVGEARIAVSQAPANPAAHARLAIYLYRSEKQAEAITEFETLLRLDPANSAAKRLLEAARNKAPL